MYFFPSEYTAVQNIEPPGSAAHLPHGFTYREHQE